ncbi:hypothetical protein [Paracoccus aestuarii]|uniref:hypothetical protein n=1 Tax=Paracoccus aestuarii TaxID=453842 RepID=UPI0011C3C126|nr:hypothetical protein [Paracoccus aestuarii]
MGKLHRSNDMSLANDFYATALAAHAFAAEVPNVREGLFTSIGRSLHEGRRGAAPSLLTALLYVSAAVRN